MKTKGQLKIQQMSLMLLFVILFFILAGLFFLVMRTNNLRSDVEMLEKDKALLNAAF